MGSPGQNFGQSVDKAATNAFPIAGSLAHALFGGPGTQPGGGDVDKLAMEQQQNQSAPQGSSATAGLSMSAPQTQQPQQDTSLLSMNAQPPAGGGIGDILKALLMGG